MADLRTTKRSKVAEIQLKQAADFLLNPAAFETPTYSLEDYGKDLRLLELQQEMLRLETVAREVGCKPGFWRRIKKVAISLKLEHDRDRYEAQFHQALAARAYDD